MKDRIRQIMESQHMTQKTFSEFIGKSQGTISSIFTGRTRATLDIIEAIKNKFPQISTDWLLFGSGEMYLSDEAAAGAVLDADADPDGEPQLQFADSDAVEVKKSSSQMADEKSKKSLQMDASDLVKNLYKSARKIKEIRVFYDDQTWETFIPSEP